MKNVIFDLDLTLVDSSIAEDERKNRNWSRVYALIPEFYIYDGLNEVFRFIRLNTIRVCIVSTAPSSYVRKVVDYFNIPFNFIIGYQDVKPIKPHPAPMLLALQLLESTNDNVVSFGDRVIDLESSFKAGIYSVGCSWGSKEDVSLRNSTFANSIIDYPREMIDFILD